MLKKIRAEASSRIKDRLSSVTDHEDDKEMQVYSPEKVTVEGDLFDGANIPRTGQGRNEPDIELFESQLMLLQDQLTSSYVTNQDLSDELSDIKRDRDELKRLLSTEQKKREELEKSVEELTKNIGTTSDRRQESHELKPLSMGSVDKEGAGLGVKNDSDLFEGELISLQEKLTATTIENSEIREELAKMKEKYEGPPDTGQGRGGPRKAIARYYQMALEGILTKIYEIADLMEQPPGGTVTAEDPALQLGMLKDNFKRCMRNIGYITSYFRWVNGIMSWARPFETLMIFILLLGSVWTGWVFQLVMIVVLAKLTYTYLCSAGLSDRFGINFLTTTEQESEPSSSSTLSTVNLVKELAQKIQNYSAVIADNIEKVYNFIHWRYPDGTMWLYKRLWGLLLLSIIIPPAYFYTFIGLAIVFKFFVMNTIYRKYPKIQAKYDTVNQIWNALPTDAQLEQRQALSQQEIQRHIASCQEQALAGDGHLRVENNGWEVHQATVGDEEVAFCERFSLGIEDVPLSDWKHGRRCTLFDKEKPLKSFKNGRIYLTASRLCFEQSVKQKDAELRFSLVLKDITYLAKAKPFGVMPGTGMSIEIGVKGRLKPYVFGGIINRDNVLQKLLDHGLMNGCEWAVDPPPNHLNKRGLAN